MDSTSKRNESASGDAQHPSNASEQAERCRRLARSAFDRSTVEMLDRMADDFERQAAGAKD